MSESAVKALVVEYVQGVKTYAGPFIPIEIRYKSGRVVVYSTSELAERDILVRLMEGNPPVGAERKDGAGIDMTITVNLTTRPAKPRRRKLGRPPKSVLVKAPPYLSAEDRAAMRGLPRGGPIA